MSVKKPAKPAKKLQLKREKLRTLGDESLRKVAGGWWTGTCQCNGDGDSCTNDSCGSGAWNHNQALLRL